jgi:hypothetical protein
MFARVMEHYARFSGELLPIKLEKTFKDIKTLADIGWKWIYVLQNLPKVPSPQGNQL